MALVAAARLSTFLLLLAAMVSCPLRAQDAGLDELIEGARAAQNSGQYGSAADLYAKATALAPGEAELWSNRGVMEFLSGRTDASVASMKRALSLSPALFAPLLFLGKDYLAAGSPAQAIPYLTRAHAARPNDVEVLLTLAKANMDSGQLRPALLRYSEVSELAAANPAAFFGLGVAALELIHADGSRLAAASNHSPWAQSLYADELLAQGRPLEATTTYHAALASAFPAERAVLLENLAWMQSHADLLQLPAASVSALQALNAEPGAHPAPASEAPCAAPSADRPLAAQLRAAACAYRNGDAQGAAAAADKVLERAPANQEALYWSVKANERIAVTALARFEELSPQSPANYVLVGNLFRLQDEAENAMAEYRKALAIDPNNASALLGAVLASLTANRLDDAAAFDQTALASQPLDPRFNLLMAEIFEARGQHAQMTPYLLKCQNAPADLQPRVHYLLGRADAEEGRTSEAISELELALPGDKDGSIHYQLARLYRKTGNTARVDSLMAEAKQLIAKREANAFTEVREQTETNP